MSVNASSIAPVTRRVRAYFAPVDRVAGTPTLFDPAQSGAFNLEAPPAPWIDLGWCSKFTRKSASSIDPLRTGSPAVAASQVRTMVEATVALQFERWGKLQLALAAGSEQMNLLATVSATNPIGSGGLAAPAVSLTAGSTATSLNMSPSDAANFAPGDWVAVDADYTGQLGFVGAGASAGYVRQASDVASDPNYIRRITLNVARIQAASNGVLQLEAPLLAGAPAAAMKASRLLGFVDREGGTFFHEWSALFCFQGEQGDRVIHHYPRLQTMQTASESMEPLIGPLERIKLHAAFRALPVVDANDATPVICFRSYLPG